MLHRPSPALAVATLALFVSLGGTGYAVAKLPKNSVGTDQLRAGAVTKAKLARDVVTQGPAGPRGPRGAQGIPGAQGVAGPQGAGLGVFRRAPATVNFAAVAGPTTVAFDVTLPAAGNWLVESEVHAAYFPVGDDYSWIKCWYSIGGLDEAEDRQYSVQVGKGSSAAAVVPIVMATTVSAAGPTNVKVKCKTLTNVPAGPPENRPFVSSISTFHAVQLTSLDVG